MRALAIAIVLAACGGTGGGMQQGDVCNRDSDCVSGDVCAANDVCWPPSDVQSVHVQWTVDGQQASPSTCASIPDLELLFLPNNGDPSQQFGYAPVPCPEGMFTELKLPSYYGAVELDDNTTMRFLGQAVIDANDDAVFDLTP